MKKLLIWLLVSISSVQESKAASAHHSDMTKLKKTCSNYCLSVLHNTNDYKGSTEMPTSHFDRLDPRETDLQIQLDLVEKRVEQKVDEVKNLIQQSMQSQVDNNFKLTDDFLAKFHNIEHAMEQMNGMWLKNFNDLQNSILTTPPPAPTTPPPPPPPAPSVPEIDTSYIISEIQAKADVCNVNIETKIDNLIDSYKTTKMSVSEPFQKIGSKYYYIEGSERVTWFQAMHKCIKYGGHLAGIQNQSEFKAIVAHLEPFLSYWIDLSDLGNEGVFYSLTTGDKADYFNWHSGEPNNGARNEHCGDLWYLHNTHKMNDANCHKKIGYICESENVD